MSKKIIGLILLIIGILMILWGVWDSYMIFNNKKDAPQLFELDYSQETGYKGSLEQQIQQVVREMFPSEFVSKLLNLISWAIFMMILVLAAGKISGLGIKLIKS